MPRLRPLTPDMIRTALDAHALEWEEFDLGLRCFLLRAGEAYITIAIEQDHVLTLRIYSAVLVANPSELNTWNASTRWPKVFATPEGMIVGETQTCFLEGATEPQVLEQIHVFIAAALELLSWVNDIDPEPRPGQNRNEGGRR